MDDTHKDCGGRIEYITLACMPPINVTRCTKCGKENRKQTIIQGSKIEL